MIEMLRKKVKNEKKRKEQEQEDQRRVDSLEKEEEEDLSKMSGDKGDEKMDDSIVSDLDLEKIENPRQRELLLLAKIKLVKEKIDTKNKLISSLKETLESDEQVKKTMQDKITELKSKIDGFRDDIVKNQSSKKLQLLIEEDDDEQFHGGLNKEIDMENENILKEHRGYEYMYTNTALANEHHNRIFILKSKTCYGKFSHNLHKILSIFLPFTSDLELLSYRYDSDVQILFQTVRFLMIVSFGVLLVFAYFLITHALTADYSTVYCKYSIPCMLFYSRISFDEIATYAITYAAMTFFVLYFAIMKWISYKQLETGSQLYDRNETMFSQFIFTSWDWTYTTSTLYNEKKRRLRSLYFQEMKEVELHEEMEVRSPKEKCCAYAIRVASFCISLIVLAIYAVAIFGAYIIRNILKSYDANKIAFVGPDVIIEIIPPILIAIFLLVFPYLFQLLVLMEKWEFKSTIREQVMYRYCIGKFWGIAVVYFANIYFNLLGNDFKSMLGIETGNVKVSTFACPGNYSLNTNYTILYDSAVNATYTPISNSLYAECPEDDSGINILFIAIAYFLFKKIYDLVAFSFLYCCSNNRKKGENYKWPFQVGHSSVEIYFLIFQLYAVIPYFPYIVILIPLINFVEFKFEIFKLLTLSSKPLRMNLKKRTGGYVMNIFAVSHVMLFVFNTTYFIGKIPHNNYLQCRNTQKGNMAFIGRQFCGPVKSWSSADQGFLDSINANSFTGFVYYVISSPEPLIVILIFAICTILYRSSDVDTYKFYVHEREKDMAQSVNFLQSQVQKRKEN